MYVCVGGGGMGGGSQPRAVVHLAVNVGRYREQREREQGGFVADVQPISCHHVVRTSQATDE